VEASTLTSLAVIACVAVVAPVLADLLKRARIPGVVIEIGLGIIVGPQLLALAEPDTVVDAFANLGLAFLMFLAGYEIDLDRIKGRPIMLATVGWLLSLGLAFAIAVVLVAEGFALSALIVGLVLTTTALGTLLPMLRDAGVLETPFGTFMLGIGTLGEFGPIVAIALLLSSDSPAHTTVLLIVFVGLAVGAALLAMRPQPPRVVALLRKNLHSSAQLPIRVSVLFIVVLVWVASELSLDVLLGAFAAGVVVRLFSSGSDSETIRVKLEAIGFGFLIPIFFIVSGMEFDLDALTSDPTTLLRVPVFLALFLVVRGVPALLLYRRDVPHSDLVPLALFSATALPLVVVITNLGVESGRMTTANAAALVGAAMLSVLILPTVAFALRSRSSPPKAVPDGEFK
jgi:Kef-type K+ transport system membrane component KefB